MTSVTQLTVNENFN